MTRRSEEKRRKNTVRKEQENRQEENRREEKKRQISTRREKKQACIGATIYDRHIKASRKNTVAEIPG